ncbi:rhoptry neck protein 2 [Plasmodium gaboni]|uniref:Rhoptry neck protein 2 n=1 Tax=Plasmodium gaboni TaxID=647221 RepID=A0ABY1UUS5_9APIC|nr:rhoptry neck protein 2 [Plasmodium gaboni]
MLKFFIFILHIYLYIDSIYASEVSKHLNHEKDELKYASPTFDPKKGTKVIFYMPGNEKGVIRNNVQNGQHGTQRNPSTVYPGSEMKNEKTGTANSEIYNKSHGSSNDNNANNSQNKTINLHMDGNNSNNSNSNNYDLNSEYEKIRRKEEEAARRIARERRADINRRNEGNNSNKHNNQQYGGYESGANTPNSRVNINITNNRTHRNPHNTNTDGHNNNMYNTSNGDYTNGGYSNGGYTNGGYSNGGYSNGGYSNGGYSNGGYANGGSSNGDYNNGDYTNGINNNMNGKNNYNTTNGEYVNGAYDGLNNGSYKLIGNLNNNQNVDNSYNQNNENDKLYTSNYNINLQDNQNSPDNNPNNKSTFNTNIDSSKSERPYFDVYGREYDRNKYIPYSRRNNLNTNQNGSTNNETNNYNTNQNESTNNGTNNYNTNQNESTNNGTNNYNTNQNGSTNNGTNNYNTNQNGSTNNGTNNYNTNQNGSTNNGTDNYNTNQDGSTNNGTNNFNNNQNGSTRYGSNSKGTYGPNGPPYYVEHQEYDNGKYMPDFHVRDSKDSIGPGGDYHNLYQNTYGNEKNPNIFPGSPHNINVYSVHHKPDNVANGGLNNGMNNGMNNTMNNGLNNGMNYGMNNSGRIGLNNVHPSNDIHNNGTEYSVHYGNSDSNNTNESVQNDYSDSDYDDHNSGNKKKVYKSVSERNRKSASQDGSELGYSDSDSDSEYEVVNGENKKYRNKYKGNNEKDKYENNWDSDNYNSDNEIKDGYLSESEREYARKKANEIEDKMNKGEYSRKYKSGKSNASRYDTTQTSDSDDSDIEANAFYVDNGQEMLIKEKEHYSSDSEFHNEESASIGNLNVYFPAENYHFSTYMGFDRRSFLLSNEIELEKMIGANFSNEVKNYCSRHNVAQKKGSYLDISFEYSRALEELRSEMLIDFNKRKHLTNNTDDTILHMIENSEKRKNDTNYKETYEDKDYANNANIFMNDYSNPLSAKYNKILKEYLCHLFVNNPGTKPLERLYYNSLALGELVEPIRNKFKNLASSTIDFNYEIHMASASNIYLLAHFLVLSLAYLSYNEYFTKGTKSFYSLPTILTANSDNSFFMLNEMCNIHYKPNKNFKKDITFIPIESRPKRFTTFYGERRLTCDLLELVLNAIMLINVNEINNVFSNNNVDGYENSLSFSNNAIRIFSKVCPKINNDNVLRCEFEESSLYNPKIIKNDMSEKSSQKNLKKAFDLLRTYAEIESNTAEGNTSPYYVSLILDDMKYNDFYKYTLWYEPRELIYGDLKGMRMTKKKNTKYIYNDFIKKSNKLRKNLIKNDLKYNLKSKGLVFLYAMIDKYGSILNKSQKTKIQFLNNTSSIRYYLYLNKVIFKSAKTYLEIMKRVLKELQMSTNTPMKFLVRGNYIDNLNNIARNDNMFYANLFVLTALSRRDPVKDYYSDKRKMLSATLSEKFANSTSMLIPHKLRKLVVSMKKGFLKKKLLTSLAKIKLLQHIPAHMLENITTSIRFTTHTIATMQIMQNAKYMSKNNYSQYDNKGMLARQIFTNGGFAEYADNLMAKWFSKGFEEYKREQIENFKLENSINSELRDSERVDENDTSEESAKKKLKDLELEEREKMKKENSFLFNQSDKWDQFINKELVRALGLWLEFNDNPTNASSFVYKLVQDSKYLLENNLDNNILFSRTVKPTKQTAFRRFFNKILSLGNMLLRKPSFRVEHALWFGATIDIKKAFILLEKVSELHKMLNNHDESWLINEAFIEIVDHVVDLSTYKHVREPFGVARNPGMMAINPKYAELSHENRLRELQNSMCADHCSSVWKVISSFALHHLKNPDSLHTYESKFSKNSFGNKIDDKDFVHNFKMILGGDAALHYFDNLLPKTMKKDLKAMKYGVSLTSAFSLKLTKIIFSQMQLPYLSQMFYMQAPYFGHFIGKWQKERQQSRIKEIMSFMTLGSLSAYTLFSAMDITQQAKDIGTGPVATCFATRTTPPQQICLNSVVSTTLTNSTQSAMKCVFSVGLFASIGPYLFAPMAGLAVWKILKSEFKVLQRIDMALKNVFKNMWNKFLSLKGISKLRGIFKRKKVMKKKIIENATRKMNEMKNNPEKAKAHQMALKKNNNYSKGTYHYISYAKIKI